MCRVLESRSKRANDLFFLVHARHETRTLRVDSDRCKILTRCAWAQVFALVVGAVVVLVIDVTARIAQDRPMQERCLVALFVSTPRIDHAFPISFFLDRVPVAGL